MKRIVFLLVLLLCANIPISYAQETNRVKEKVRGFEKTKKEYSVLTSNPKIRHGAYKEYYKKHLVVNGFYKNGRKDGLWEYKSPNSKYLQKGVFEEGEMKGEWLRRIEGKDYKANSEKIDLPFQASLKKPVVLMQNSDKNKNHKEAFSQSINIFMKENIGDLHNLVKTPGVYRVMIIFKINMLGEVENIRVKAKNKILIRHIKEVVSNLPTYIPAYKNDTIVNLMFQLPLMFRVAPPKKEDPFKGLEGKKRSFKTF